MYSVFTHTVRVLTLRKFDTRKVHFSYLLDAVSLCSDLFAVWSAAEVWGSVVEASLSVENTLWGFGGAGAGAFCSLASFGLTNCRG